jgi:vacuolar-type H+-ATPase subunit C/Vma6
VELLQIPDYRGYPTEYLLARTRGKRAYLIKDWDKLIYTPEPSEYLLSTRYGRLMSQYAEDGAWIQALNEYHWFYFQMNKKLRSIFRPFFLYHEISTIVHCLRYKLEEDTGTDREMVLFFSLLSERIKKILMMDADLPSTLKALDKLYSSPDYKKTKLGELFSVEGLKGVEQKITGICLNEIIRSRLHPVMKSFFETLVDAINIMTIYKFLRWNIRTESLLVEGGSIRSSTLKRLIRTGGNPDITEFIKERTGLGTEELTASRIENRLHRGITKKARVLKRDGSDIGTILDYLWKCSTEARNLGILLHGKNIDRDVLREELAI